MMRNINELIDKKELEKWESWKASHLFYYNNKQKEILNSIRNRFVNLDYETFIEWVKNRFAKEFEREFYKRVYKRKSVISYLEFMQDFIKYSRGIK